jgi:tetratricopeptide (TPR) repeat protein
MLRLYPLLLLFFLVTSSLSTVIKRILFLFILMKVSVNTLAQTPQLDSLKLELKNSKHDTTKVKTEKAFGDLMYNLQPDSALPIWIHARELAEKNLPKYRTGSQENKTLKKALSGIITNIGYVSQDRGDFDKAIECFTKSMELEEELGNRSGIAFSFNNLGVAYENKGTISKALECYNESLKLREELGDKYSIATSLNNIAGIYHNQGNVPKAIEYLSRSLKFLEESEGKSELAGALNNIGFMYKSQGDISKALEYYEKSLKLLERIGDKSKIAELLNNIGTIYSIQGNIQKALECMSKSLEIKEGLGEKKGIASMLNNIGGIYRTHGDPSVSGSKENIFKAGIEKAAGYFEKSLKLWEELGDKRGIAIALANRGDMYLEQKNYGKAGEYLKKSMAISKELAFPENIKNAAHLLSKLFKETGDYRSALENRELFIQMRDSLNNEKTRKASIKSQLKYEYEKQAAADSVAHAKENEIKSAELSRQAAEIKAKKNQQYALFGGLALVIVFSIFMYNRFKVTQKQKVVIEKQKEIVEEQKHLVEEKQREVLESIHYAKRIQLAQIPSEKMVWSMIIKTKRN